MRIFANAFGDKEFLYLASLQFVVGIDRDIAAVADAAALNDSLGRFELRELTF